MLETILRVVFLALCWGIWAGMGCALWFLTRLMNRGF